MHISIVAADFDGTMSQGDVLAPEAGHALRRWRESGRFTALVSGRSFEFLHALQEREQAFDLIVAENGAVLYNTHTDEMFLPFGEVPDDLIDTLEKLGVPLWRGIAIAGTRTPYDDAAWVASRELGLPVHVETNRSEVMLLPQGASKGAGLLHLLQRVGMSPRNVVAIGDAENDLSLLQAAEVKVAVANAIKGLKEIADYVTPEPEAAGVARFVERYLLDGQAFDFPVRSAHHFGLGADVEFSLNAHDLVDREILIAGGSGCAKSWLASRLAEGLIDGGYQILTLDPVGDLHALRRPASCLSLGREETPSIGLVLQLLAETDLSLVLDMSRLQTREEQVLYTTGLLRHVLDMRRRLGKPHWILIDEAQDLLGGSDNPARIPLLQSFESFGVCLVTWQPSALDQGVLDRVHGFVLTRHRLHSEVACLSRLMESHGLDVTGLSDRLAQLGEGQMVSWGLTAAAAELELLRFRSGPRVFPAMRHLHKYVEERVSRSKQFYFRDPAGNTPPAGNLGELIDRLRGVDVAVLTYHFERGDYTRWIRDVFRDETLARWIDRLHAANLAGEDLRAALLDVLEQRYRVLERLV
ncbi:MAG: HAD hydrolase family protein [Anaerolineae bacterium]|nr:HAD hydrolase family protein [Anaerolineae bacterium]